MASEPDFTVSTVGERRFDSPLALSSVAGDGIGKFIDDDQRVLFQIRHRAGETPGGPALELAGPRAKIFFDPPQTRAAIVTCGGLCPGINNVIRTLYFELTKNYGLSEVLGIRYGFQGLNPSVAHPPVVLNDGMVAEIQHLGGTILGTSRGEHPLAAMVDYLERAKIDILFCIGGDGTQRGVHAMAEEICRQGAPIAIVGIPKTIDNDIQLCWRTFGFLTAVSEADRVIDRAHTEAIGVVNGVGLVKLMGREAGYIAAAATIASGHVNFALIPEVPFKLEGEGGLLTRLERRLAARGHAVIVVAEGAGQDLLPDHEEAYDPSGNRKLGDIGLFLKSEIVAYCKSRKIPIDVKYFDPSYHIRSCPASTADELFCEQLARSAAHAAMAGKTDVMVGAWHNEFVHVPLGASVRGKKRIAPEDDIWATVLAVTGQEKW